MRSVRICLHWHVSKPPSIRTLPSPPFQTTQYLIGVMNFPPPSYKDSCALPPGYSAMPHYSLYARYKTNGTCHPRTHMCIYRHRQLIFEFWILYRTLRQFLIAFVLGAAALWLAYVIRLYVRRWYQRSPRADRPRQCRLIKQADTIVGLEVQLSFGEVFRLP